MNKPMTPEQLKNFRDVLCFTLGSYALLMPDEDVVKMRDRYQEIVNKEALSNG